MICVLIKRCLNYCCYVVETSFTIDIVVYRVAIKYKDTYIRILLR